MKQLFIGLVLLLSCGLALAGSTVPHVFSPDSVTNSTDISINYLTQLFGSVGTVLSGGGSQMMGHLFKYLNWGIFSLSTIVIGYAVFMAVIRLATEGATQQQGKSTLFILVKLAIGVSLVIPSSVTGYSLLQDIVMKVVVYGVSLADTVWDHGLEYLDEGGVMWIAPVSYHDKANWMMTQKNITALVGSNSMGADVFKSEVCMLANGNSSVVNSDSGSSVAVTSQPQGPFNPSYDTKKNIVNFPGASGNNACGSVSWDIQGSCDPVPQQTVCGGSNCYTPSPVVNAAHCSMTQTGVTALVTALLPAAKRYYCAKASAIGDPACSGVDAFTGSNDVTGIKPYMYNVMIKYYAAMRDFNIDKQKKAKADQTVFIKAAKEEGWLTAGRYYWDMMRMINTSENAGDLSTYVSSVTAPSTSKSAYETASTDFAGASDQVKPGVGNLENDIANPNTSNGAIISSGAIAAVVAPTVVVPGLSATLGTAAAGLNSIGDMFSNFTKNDHQNPIKFFYDVGNECIQVVINIWIVGAILITANVMVASICAASNPFGYGTTAMVDWVKPILMLIATMLWAAGFFLVYYVPLYPYMIFLFASIGWFISVIEAMVAAPLVALGLAHPENHDFLGKSEQAIMLLLGVFMQPVLLVVGLIAGIILSYVSFELLIYTFSGFITDVMGAPQNMAGSNIMWAVMDSHIYKGSVGGLLLDPVLLILFCVIAYTVLTQSFSVTYLLRDNVMRWIGAPGSGLANPEQLASETKGVASSMGKQTGQAMGDVAGGAPGAFEKSQDQKDKMENRESKGGGSGGLDGGGGGGAAASAG